MCLRGAQFLLLVIGTFSRTCAKWNVTAISREFVIFFLLTQLAPVNYKLLSFLCGFSARNFLPRSFLLRPTKIDCWGINVICDFRNQMPILSKRPFSVSCFWACCCANQERVPKMCLMENPLEAYPPFFQSQTITTPSAEQEYKLAPLSLKIASKMVSLWPSKTLKLKYQKLKWNPSLAFERICQRLKHFWGFITNKKRKRRI